MKWIIKKIVCKETAIIICIFQLGLVYVMLSQHYGLKINVKSFREYCTMDQTEAKQFTRKLIEAMHGYRDALSGVLQGKQCDC